jgi:hypothetical protein
MLNENEGETPSDDHFGAQVVERKRISFKFVRAGPGMRMSAEARP